MKVYNQQNNTVLSHQMTETLQHLRAKRGFDAQLWIDTKVRWINQYFNQYGLHTAVVATSGGIDSATVLALVAKCASQPHAGVKNVLPVMLPAFVTEGASNQNDTIQRGQACADAVGYKPLILDVAPVHEQIQDLVEPAMNAAGTSWASGQLVAYARTPMLYYVTSLLSDAGTPGVICGTTNRDEGAYLGYVGKASDGMVDLQLISDLHKSEVRAVAELLGVPQSVLDTVPTGDMYDARPDEEVFGAPYDFVELYLLWLCLNNQQQERMQQEWDTETQEQFILLSERLEHLHNYNRHKYMAGSPAVHLDLYPSAVPGGWSEHRTWLPGGNS